MPWKRFSRDSLRFWTCGRGPRLTLKTRKIKGNLVAGGGATRFIWRSHGRWAASALLSDRGTLTRPASPQILELFEFALLLAQSARSCEDETKRKVDVGPTHPAALNEVLDRRGERAQFRIISGGDRSPLLHDGLRSRGALRGRWPIGPPREAPKTGTVTVAAEESDALMPVGDGSQRDRDLRAAPIVSRVHGAPPKGR
jgi:hypothetical protein